MINVERDSLLLTDSQPAEMDGHVTLPHDSAARRQERTPTPVPQPCHSLGRAEIGGTSWDGVGQDWHDMLTGT